MAVSHEVDPVTYLEMCFTQDDVNKTVKEFALKNVHNFFAQKHSTSEGMPLKVLDYGCGPVVAFDISAAKEEAEIVLAEYGENCRQALQDWLNCHSSAWDWTPYIKHVVCDLERKNENEVAQREENLRKAIKAVVPCDITKDPPIAKGFEGPYDIVMSMLCIENGCLTKDEYKAAIRRIASLTKKGGNFLLYSSVRNRGEHDETPGYYHVGTEKHIQVALPLHFVIMTLKESEFLVVETNQLPTEKSTALRESDKTDLESTAFITLLDTNNLKCNLIVS